MGELIDLMAEREARAPHLSFEVECVECRYVWIAIVPAPLPSAVMFQCPDCERASRGEERWKGKRRDG
jgi:hypothetical protein